MTEKNRRRDEWVSVEDRLPVDLKKEYLVVDMGCTNDYSYPYTPEESVDRACYGKRTGAFFSMTDDNDDGVEPLQVTHWKEIVLP